MVAKLSWRSFHTFHPRRTWGAGLPVLTTVTVNSHISFDSLQSIDTVLPLVLNSEHYLQFSTLLITDYDITETKDVVYLMFIFSQPLTSI